VVELVTRTAPDVVIVDLCMPAPDGIACIDALRAHHPSTTVIALSALDDPRAATQALDRGASAFVRKDIDPRDLVAVLRQTLEGTVVSQHPSFHDAGVADEAKSPLSKAELAVLAALVAGQSNRQIAEELCVAQQTVKFHLTNIYRKLGVANRTEAIGYAYEHGLAKTSPWPLARGAAA
jgi:DNA-binding NarL/FixJ family response regulator